jgi:hypothetical protein
MRTTEAGKGHLVFLQRKAHYYSLLIGVHEIGKGSEKDEKERSEAMDVISSRTDTAVQYFGIVDILTRYAIQKKAETIFTGIMMCRPGISCQPPKRYQQRFMAFVDADVLASCQ